MTLSSAESLVLFYSMQVMDLSMDARKSKVFVSELLAKAAAAAAATPSPSPHAGSMAERVLVPLGGAPYPPPPTLTTPAPLRPPPLSLSVPPAPISTHPSAAAATGALVTSGACSFRAVVEFVYSGSRIKVIFLPFGLSLLFADFLF